MATIIQQTMAAGEVSPSMYARTDLAKYHAGLAISRNFYVDYTGGVSNREGFRFLARTKYKDKKSRLVTFRFSNADTYALEFGNLYMRVYRNQSLVLNDATTITDVTQANPAVVTTSGAHGYSNGQTVYLSGIAGMTELNADYYLVANVTGTTFELTDLDGNNINSSGYTAYSSGGSAATVYELTTPWLEAQLFELDFAQDKNTITVSHQSYYPREIVRTDHNDWAISILSIEPTLAQASNLAAAVTPTSTTAYYSYIVTGVDALGNESRPSTALRVNNQVAINATAGAISLTWDPIDGAIYYNVYRAAIAYYYPVKLGATHGFIGSTYNTNLVDTNITPDFSRTPPTHYDPFAYRAVESIEVTAGGSGYSDASTTLSMTGVTNWEGYPIVDSSGAIVAVVTTRRGKDGSGASLSASGGTGATFTVNIAADSPLPFPGCCCHAQQRRMFASSEAYPQRLWGSRYGLPSNFDFTNPTVENDSFELDLSGEAVNKILTLLSMPGGVVAFTDGGLYQITGSGELFSPITPVSSFATPQMFPGTAGLYPLVIGYEILYIENNLSTVWALTYNSYSNTMQGDDITILSNHLFKNQTIVDWAYSASPNKRVWVVRDDGMLLCMTFLKSQEIYGWTQHDTKGLFESCCSVKEGTEDVLYVATRRYINGQWVRMVEAMSSRSRPNGIEDAKFVDCFLDYPLEEPAAELTFSAITGAGVTVTASASVFSAGDVGRIIRAGGGKATITAYSSGTSVTVTFTRDISEVVPNDETRHKPVLSGEWTLGTEVTTVTGLKHLIGETVSILADGKLVTPQVVSATGTITLATAASKIIVGLPYKQYIRTLPLDAGEPTIAGKKKIIPSISLKAVETPTIWMGTALDQMDQYHGQVGSFLTYGDEISSTTGDLFLNIDSIWDESGQIYIEQQFPLPATIIGYVPDFIVGDQ